MVRDSDVERIVAVLQETRNTPMTLAKHCTVALAKLERVVDSFEILSDSAPCQGFAYASWSSRYNVSISLRTGGNEIYESFAFALLVIKKDCYGQLVHSLGNENTEQMFREKQLDIKELADVLRQLPLKAD